MVLINRFRLLRLFALHFSANVNNVGLTKLSTVTSQLIPTHTTTILHTGVSVEMGMINQISVSCSDPDIIHSSYIEQMSPVHV